MRRSLLAACAALMLAAVPASAPASAKEIIRFGYLTDASHEAVMWALRNGKVTSDTVEVQATALDIPALLQATPARTYDVIQTAALAIPRARERGLDLRVIGTALRSSPSGEGGGIWVRQDSPLRTVEDLRGKKLAVYSLSSAGITLIRMALAEGHGLNVATRRGDIEFVEVPAPAMPAALATGRVDAATLIHTQVYRAGTGSDFRVLVETGKDLQRLYGVEMVSAMLAGYGDKLDAKPEVYVEFLRLLRASMEYAINNRAEVFAAVGKANDIEPAFFDAWFDRFSQFPVTMTEGDVKALDILFQQAVKLRLLDQAPSAASVIWNRAPRAATP